MIREVLSIEEVTVFNTYLFPLLWITAGIFCACWISYKQGERAASRSSEAWYDSCAECFAVVVVLGGVWGLATLCGRYETVAQREMAMRREEFDRDIEHARRVAREHMPAEPIEAEAPIGRLSPVLVK